MLLCLGLGAAGIAAAEVTLEGFPTHWTQDEAYRTYTPEHCPPGCVAIAGAAIVQYYKVGEGPEQTSNTCRVNDEARTLSTADETYNWEKPDADDYGRLAYNLGVRLGMSYETTSSSVAFAKLEGVLEDYGLASTYMASPGADKYGELLGTALRLGWPVALSIGGDGTSFTIPDDPTLAGSGSLNETLYAWFADESRETAVSSPSRVSIGFAQLGSYLGDRYGNKYGRVPDTWLLEYFREDLPYPNEGAENPQNRDQFPAIAEGDFDGDGLLNWQEYVAGTDPRDASSRFRITGFTLENGVPTLTWAPNLPNRDYPSKARPPSMASGRTTPARTPASSASPWTPQPTDP